ADQRADGDQDDGREPPARRGAMEEPLRRLGARGADVGDHAHGPLLTAAPRREPRPARRAGLHPCSAYRYPTMRPYFSVSGSSWSAAKRASSTSTSLPCAYWKAGLPSMNIELSSTASCQRAWPSGESRKAAARRARLGRRTPLMTPALVCA